ncbi:NAD(P)-dependent oxidoreductase [Sphingorhabdus soli]|uniref:NAD(P)-dependent oxidoreductase n=1 Tax=Flavisphingopyxis soli TaxID=2601267 RepID=A0A5C6U6B2_9SPHN|nr:NAD(P)-dependent oxidoreductase [Sphingorhabdus soli]TXC68299.1 NAD(P)-dependent oxidoreductase [Sphingorhabdus soli]
MAKIAFIGTGVMGAPMARHLATAGHTLALFNRSRDKAERAAGTFAATVHDSPADAARGCDIVISCVGNDDDLAEVMLGSDGALSAMAKGSLAIDHTTVSADLARRIEREAGDHGVLALDAPVSGGQAGAENGSLAIMCGGSDAAFTAAEPVMDAYASRIVHVGAAGAGQTAKMVNQIAIAGVIEGLSEAIAFAQAAGLDMDKTFEAVSGGAAGSWQMSNRWATMAKDEFDFGFAVDWMRKDLGLALDEARRNGASVPVAALVDQFYADVQAMGGARQDTSSLIRRLKR